MPKQMLRSLVPFSKNLTMTFWAVYASIGGNYVLLHVFQDDEAAARQWIESRAEAAKLLGCKLSLDSVQPPAKIQPVK